jgi:hypothetical protein
VAKIGEVDMLCKYFGKKVEKFSVLENLRVWFWCRSPIKKAVHRVALEKGWAGA